MSFFIGIGMGLWIVRLCGSLCMIFYLFGVIRLGIVIGMLFRSCIWVWIR